jgi:hypothetical protein
MPKEDMPMEAILLLALAAGLLLYLFEVVLGAPCGTHDAELNIRQGCVAVRRLTPAEFLGAPLPMLLASLAGPLALASPGIGLCLGLAALASFLLGRFGLGRGTA